MDTFNLKKKSENTSMILFSIIDRYLYVFVIIINYLFIYIKIVFHFRRLYIFYVYIYLVYRILFCVKINNKK